MFAYIGISTKGRGDILDLTAAILGPFLTVPVVDGNLTLGSWQQVVLVDCDTRTRNREIVVQIIY